MSFSKPSLLYTLCPPAPLGPVTSYSSSIFQRLVSLLYICDHSSVVVCLVCVTQLVSQSLQDNSTLSANSILRTEDESLFRSVRILCPPLPLILDAPLTIQLATFSTTNGIADKVSSLPLDDLIECVPLPLAVACELAVWWKGSHYLTIYPLQEPTGKSTTVSPSQHILQASPIAHSCISEDSAMLALALDSGVAVLWDVRIGTFVQDYACFVSLMFLYSQEYVVKFSHVWPHLMPYRPSCSSNLPLLVHSC